jgi:hypothetical protein
MEYEITAVSHEGTTPELEGVYDSPQIVKSDLEYLRKTFPGKHFRITRNGTQLTDVELDADFGNSSDLQEAVDESSRLPVITGGVSRDRKG